MFLQTVKRTTCVSGAVIKSTIRRRLLGGEAEAAAVNTITSTTTVLSHVVSALSLPLLQPLYITCDLTRKLLHLPACGIFKSNDHVS